MLGVILVNIFVFIVLACMFKLVLNELYTLIFVDLKKIKDENKD